MRNSSSARCRRESLEFGDWDEMLAHARSLGDVEYQRLGNWSLGQVCSHLAATMELSIDGFPTGLPAPVAAVMQWSFFNLPFMPGVVSRLRAPTIRALAQDDPVDDQEGLQRLAAAVARVSAPGVEFQRNPVMGQLTAERWHRFHLWHAQHHLSFLKPAAENAACCGGGENEVVESPAVSQN